MIQLVEHKKSHRWSVRFDSIQEVNRILGPNGSLEAIRKRRDVTLETLAARSDLALHSWEKWLKDDGPRARMNYVSHSGLGLSTLYRILLALHVDDVRAAARSILVIDIPAKAHKRAWDSATAERSHGKKEERTTTTTTALIRNDDGSPHALVRTTEPARRATTVSREQAATIFAMYMAEAPTEVLIGELKRRGVADVLVDELAADEGWAILR